MTRHLFGLTFSAAFLAALPAPTLAGADNLFVNPGFEELGGSYDGWTVFGSGPQISLPATDDIARSGAASAKVFGEFTGCPGSPQFDVGGFLQEFTPVPGDMYELTGYSYIVSDDPIPGTDSCSGNRLIAQIAFFDVAVGGSPIATNEVILGDFLSTVDQWVRFSVETPAPSNALRVEALFLFLQPGCDTGAVFVDDVHLRTYTPSTPSNMLVNPSFDTDLSGWDTFGNVFHDARNFARRTPTGGVKMFSTFTEDSPSGLFQSFAAVAGSSWELSAFTMSTCVEDPVFGANDNYASARIVFRDAGGIEVGAEEVILQDAASPIGTWTKHTVSGTAPAGTATAEAFVLFISPTIMGGAIFVDDVRFGAPVPVSVPGVGSLTFDLQQNVPNPFNPTTRIAFELTAAQTVSIDVYDVAGRWVTSLYQGHLEPGSHAVRWNGTRANGSDVASGVYRYALRTEDGYTSRRMTLLK